MLNVSGKISTHIFTEISVLFYREGVFHETVISTNTVF